MTILYLLVPIALLLAGAGVWAFFWSVKNGQYDDVETPAIRILLDDADENGAAPRPSGERRPGERPSGEHRADNGNGSSPSRSSPRRGGLARRP